MTLISYTILKVLLFSELNLTVTLPTHILTWHRFVHTLHMYGVSEIANLLIPSVCWGLAPRPNPRSDMLEGSDHL
jgi:hypothetical protein